MLSACSANAAVVLQEIRGEVVARAEFDCNRVALSGDVALTLTVEGPARVEVAPPRPLLAKASAQAWRVREMGLPLVEVLGNGRRRWKQEYRLSPFEVGPKVEVALSPLKVAAGSEKEREITWSQAAPIEVVTSIGEPDLKSLRPITDIERPPPAPIRETDRRGLFLLGAGVGLFLLALIGRSIWLRNRRLPLKPDFGAEWARQELCNAHSFEKLAEVLRLYLQDRFDIPATRLTSSEVIADLQRGNLISLSLVEELRTILERCDTAKFTEGDTGDCSRFIESAAQFILKSHESPGTAIFGLSKAI